MISVEQHEQLLKGINPSRVQQRQQAGRSLSYLEAWDVKAHLIRIFGFLGWSADVIESELVFEEKNEKGNWDVAYKVALRLRIHADDNFLGEATYTEAAVGSASLPRRGDAHDMAIKTAESDALKRAAINLGDQFGLSLYHNGSLKPVVQMTMAVPTNE
jgi:recombination DNA repair RAD52 pathway protein